MGKPQSKYCNTENLQSIKNSRVFSSNHAVDSSTEEKRESTKNEPNQLIACHDKMHDRWHDWND
jgi:hypothetical protein